MKERMCEFFIFQARRVTLRKTKDGGLNACEH